MSEREEKGTSKELQGKTHAAAAPYLYRLAEKDFINIFCMDVISTFEEVATDT